MVFAFIGTTEIIIILIVALIVFGPQKLPEIGRQVGSAMRELQRVRNDVQRALDIDEYTRLDLPSYEPPTYGSTYAYEPENNSYDSSVYDTPVNRDFIPPPGPLARQIASSASDEGGVEALQSSNAEAEPQQTKEH